MKKLSISLSCVLFSVLVFAQKVINDPNAEKRNAAGYHGISVSDGIDLYLSQGEESVAVSASETKYRDRVHTEVKDGILHIWYEHATNLNIDWNNNRKLKAYVAFKDLSTLSASGGSDIYAEGGIKVTALAMHTSGGCDFRGKVEADKLDLDVSGGSDTHISGHVKVLNVIASGGSDFRGYDLSTDICGINASGGSDAYVTAEKELKVDASGGSDVYYKGKATVVDMKSSGSSSVRRSEQ